MRRTRSEPSSRPDLTAADRERLARRYPDPRLPRPLLVTLVTVLALVSLSWLVRTALIHSHPVVTAKVSAYTVVSNARIDATVTVDRRDPAVVVVCRISAQAMDFQPVGEVNLEVAATADQVVNRTISITTLRRASTAVVRECAPI